MKALGNPEGPYVLASELVGTQLAEWFGLSVFDYALVDVLDDDELPFINGGYAQPGPAFISSSEAGYPWGGDESELTKLANPDDISRLVVFDTWIRNRDRHHQDPRIRKPNRDNVFLSKSGAVGDTVVLKAIDHTHCFATTTEFAPKMANISEIQDQRVYGLFPEFGSLVTRPLVEAAASDLANIQSAQVEAILGHVPGEWGIRPNTKRAWSDLIVRRAQFVADHVVGYLFPQEELALGEL